MPVDQLTDLESDLSAVRSPKTPAAADDLSADLQAVRPAPSPWDDLRRQMRATPGGTTGNPTLDDALRREAPNGELDAIHRASALTAPPTVQPAPVPAPSLFEQPELPPGYTTATRGRYTGLPVPAEAAHGPSSRLPDPLTEGVQQIVRGVTQGTPMTPSDAVTRPHGAEVPFGTPSAPTPQLLNAGSDLIEGAMKLGTPLAIAGAILDLPAAAGAMFLSWLAGKAAGKGAEAAGLSPEAQRFTSNVASAVTALGGAKVVYDRITALPDVAKASARPLILAGKLNAPGFGTGDVPAYRTIPVTEETGGAPPLGRQAEAGRPAEVPPEVSTKGTTFESPDVTAATELPSGAKIVPQDLEGLPESRRPVVERTIEEGRAAGVPENDTAQALERDRLEAQQQTAPKAATQATETSGITTLAGRVLAPPVQKATTTDRGVKANVLAVDRWLVDEAKNEAAHKNDDFNATWINGLDPKRLSQGDRDSLNQYLFGTEEGVQFAAPKGETAPTTESTPASVTAPLPSAPAEEHTESTPAVGVTTPEEQDDLERDLANAGIGEQPAAATEAPNGKRQALINQIAEASRKPAPTVVPSVESKGSDGKWYAGDFPIGVNSTGETRIRGYVIRTEQGTTVGTVEKTPEAVRARVQRIHDKDVEDFRQHLEKEPDERLASQARYWLKDEAEPLLEAAGINIPKPKPAKFETRTHAYRLRDDGRVDIYKKSKDGKRQTFYTTSAADSEAIPREYREQLGTAQPLPPAAPRTPEATSGAVSHNAERNSIEVKFPAKPAPHVIAGLKVAGYHWYGKGGLWYRKIPTGLPVKTALENARQLFGAETAAARTEAPAPKPEKVQLTDEQRAQGQKDLKKLEKEYGVQSTRVQANVRDAETPEELAAALEEMRAAGLREHDKQAEAEGQRRARIDERKKQYLEEGRKLVAAGKPIAWRLLHFDKEQIWKPVEGKLVELTIPRAPAGLTFAIFRGDLQGEKGWIITEQSTGLTLTNRTGGSPTQKAAIEAVLNATAHVTPEQWDAALAKARKTAPPKPDLTAPAELSNEGEKQEVEAPRGKANAAPPLKIGARVQADEGTGTLTRIDGEGANGKIALEPDGRLTKWIPLSRMTRATEARAGSRYEGDNLEDLLGQTREEQRGRFEAMLAIEQQLEDLKEGPKREQLLKELADLDSVYQGTYSEVIDAAGDDAAEEMQDVVEEGRISLAQEILSARPGQKAKEKTANVKGSLPVDVYDALIEKNWPTADNAGAFRKQVAARLGKPESVLVDDIDALNDGAEAALNHRFEPALDVGDSFHEAQRIEQLMPRAHRSLEKTKLQQFSTPLPIAVWAAFAADVQDGDHVLDPTAGTGNLLAPIKDNSAITVAANELGQRRADLLRVQAPDYRAKTYTVTQGDYLGQKLAKPPTVIIANPPWGKYTTGKYGKAVSLGFTPGDVAERFLAKMLRDVAHGGRISVVMPTTMMGVSSAGFRHWLQRNATVLAIIQSPPGAYDTRATTVDSLLVVLDNLAPIPTNAGAVPKLPAVVVAKDWNEYAQAVHAIPKREGPAERPTREAAESAPERGAEPVRGGRVRAGGAESGRGARVPAGRDTGLVADRRGPAEQPGAAGPRAGDVVEQPERATLDALSTPAGEFTDVVDHSADDRRSATGSRQFAPYVRRATFPGVRHPKLIVEARQLAGVPYPALTIEPGVAVRTALAAKRVSVEQAEQALAVVQANVVGHHGMVAADNVGVGKSREIALVILELMERAKKEGRELRLLVSTKSRDNIVDLIDNELYYTATGRTIDGRDLLNVDAPKVVPKPLPFEIVKTDSFPDAKREGNDYKPLPRHPRAIYVTDFYNFSAFRQALVDVSPHGLLGDEAHKFTNIEGSAAGGAWQNVHAEIMRNVPREQQVFGYFTATPAQSVNDYQYLYGLRLWPIDGFTQWAQLATGNADEKAAERLKDATDKGAFDIKRLTDSKGTEVIGGDSEDVQKEDSRRGKFGIKSFADIFTSRLSPAEAEQIPREWKLLGRFSARDLWRHGQEFTVHEAKLEQRHIDTYNRFSALAQRIAMAAYRFGLLDKSGKSSRFGVTGQLQFAAKRIQMQPALEEAITVAKEKLAQGYQVVLSVINVTEMDPQKGNIAAAIEKINTRVKDVDPDDPDGGVIDQGEIPEAIIAREELLEAAKDIGHFPDPVEMVEEAFGKEKVALIIGSSGTQRRVAMKEFQEGKRTVAFLSQAGSTGINLDHRVLTNQKPGRGRRVFIDVQFEWSAREAIQRYGRVGRAASVTQPILMPITFGNASEKKFLATIANRMASLGALSKGGAETTGAEGLEEFEITGPEAAEAARLAYNDMSDDDKRKFAVVKSVYRSPNRDNDDPFEPAARAPSTARMQDAQLALLFVPIETSNAFWKNFVKHREALREAMGYQSSRTEAVSGKILQTIELGEKGNPLTLTEVQNLKGEKFGILSGVITPRMPRIREFLYIEHEQGGRTFSRKYLTFTAVEEGAPRVKPTSGPEIVSGLRIPWRKVAALADAFGAELTREKLDTPEKVLDALKQNINLELAHTTDVAGVRTHWTIGMRKDGKITIGHAKMADRTLLLNNGAAYSPVGNFWFTTPEKLPQFLERFPLKQEVAPTKAASTKKPGGGGASFTAQATIVPGAQEFVEQDVVPRLKTAAETFARAAVQLRQSVAPATVSAGVHVAGILRAKMADEAQLNDQMMRASHQFQQAFDALLAQPHGKDLAVDWWDAVQTGQPTKILPELKPAYDYMRAALDEERTAVQRVGKLEEFNEFYFPQIWKFPRAEADFVRRLMGGLLGKRPFEGSKSFLKQRKYPTFREGLKALQPKGVEPISWNPVDHFRIKMREMRRYRTAREAIQMFGELGLWKLFTGPKPPEGWTRIEGPLGTLYGPPQIAMKEAFDPMLFEGLEKFARSLGVRLTRKVNIGGRRWGYAEGDTAITTKAAGPETVLEHEIGHILDERYGLRGMVKDKKFKQELRDLADLRHEGTAKEDVPPGRLRYERKGEEKIANLVHAFLYAPERAKKIAPNSYWALWNLTKAHKELRPLRALQKTRSLRLGVRTHAIDIGGFPELGHYAMPDDAARVFNNHLSAGLAGRSAIYDAYRWLNNTMVMGQLAFSGLRHLTFTGINALVSEGALALQEATRAVQTKNWTLLERAATRAATVAASGVAGGAAGYALGGPIGVLWASGYPLAAAKFIKGWRAQQQWLKEEPGMRVFSHQVRQMIEGGFRPTWDQLYRTSALQNALRAIKQGNYPGALARTIPALIDLVGVPVMQFAVPGVKTAAYLDLAAFELERLQAEVGAVEEAEKALADLPAGKQRKYLTKEQQAVIRALESQRADNLAVIREALNKVQASIDNRFGEVVYDNWFWKRWLKDLTHVVFRAPGWQAGTYKELLGAIPAQARLLRLAASGGGGDGAGKGEGAPGGGESTTASEPPSSTGAREDLLAAPMAYVLTLVGMLMIINGLAHYLATGEKPQGKDWMYPKGPDGVRRAPPTYLTTFLSAQRHPLGAIANTSAPLNAALYRTLVSNQTYSGEIIRDPADPWLKQAWDALRDVAKEGYQPFLAENIARGQGGVESTMGVSRAPAEVNRSAAENYLHDVMPPQVRTHEQQEKLEDRRALRDAVTAKNPGAVATAIGEGALSKASVRETVRRAARPGLVNQFQAATLPQALHAYALATPEERFALRPLLYKKYGSLIKTIPPAERTTMIEQFTAARALPVRAPEQTAAAAAR